ncbi:MAG: hypothetical protein M8354_12190 [Halalkalicoccus sp.]|nr:hypothetical protein [Halalkalicoccus sp.]
MTFDFVVDTPRSWLIHWHTRYHLEEGIPA